ncbi:MAG: hypothetical protein ACOYUB_02265 [Patescibacteria group bacterium]
MGAESYNAITKNLQRIQVLHDVFNKTNGIKTTRVMNYDPVLARWKFEEADAKKNRKKFKKYERFQVETALRERDHTAKSSIKYIVGGNGEIYNELFPDEPFSTVLERGLAYRQQHGSKEIAREKSEIAGWRKITSSLADPETPAGTKAVVVSGPGLIEDTNYHDNFVDVYEAVDTPSGKRQIQMTRFSSQLDYEQYWNKIQSLDRNYFQESNLPIDAWMLSHPILFSHQDQRTADQIFDGIFEKRKDSMTESDFQKLLVLCMPVINYYINALTQDRYDPRVIALSWNAVLQKNDIVRHAIANGRDLNSRDAPFNGNIAMEIDWLGRQVIETVAAGCGSSEGFKLKDKALAAYQNPLVNFLENSVAKFGYDIKKNNDRNSPESQIDEHGKLTFDCPNKNSKDPVKRCDPGVITRPPHVLLPNCPHCGASIKC